MCNQAPEIEIKKETDSNRWQLTSLFQSAL